MAKDIQSCWIAFYKMPANARDLTCENGFVWVAHGMRGEAAVFWKSGFTLAPSVSLPDGPNE